ncbi:hypothetical protein GFL77_02685 [Rhizobium leguminosarum bv. viciae]|nr:hypothetical protein [Rhizobium leguminosarum bv. viciae]
MLQRFMATDRGSSAKEKRQAGMSALPGLPQSRYAGLLSHDVKQSLQCGIRVRFHPDG